MPHPGQNKFALLERRRNVARRYLRGELQWQIARAFEVDQSTISRDLEAIHDEWLRHALFDLTAIKARELARVNEAEREAWRGWQRSQRPAEKLTTNVGADGLKASHVREGQAGDPRFLQLILNCVERRCKILGVDRQPDDPGALPARTIEIVWPADLPDPPPQLNGRAEH